jgi:hypothetical protein
VGQAPWSWANSAALLDQGSAYLIQGQTYLFGLPLPLPAMTSSSWLKFFSVFGLAPFWDAYRFNRNAVADKVDLATRDLPLGDLIKLRGYGDGFVRGFLLPMLSMVCGCHFADLLAYPAGVILEFWASTGYGNQFHASKGSGDVAQKLLARVTDIRLGCAVLVRPLAFFAFFSSRRLSPLDTLFALPLPLFTPGCAPCGLK